MKQVIVMRKDLNMRKGKMIAQGAHAAMGFLIGLDIKPNMITHLDSVMKNKQWLDNGMTKICVGVDSLEELEDIVEKARLAGIHVYTVEDAGRTELEPGTITCCAIGPNNNEDIDKITGHLKLL